MDIYSDFSEDNNVIATQMLVTRYENGIKNQKIDYFDIDEIDLLVSHYVENSLFDKALQVIKTGRSIHTTCDDFLYQEANLLLTVHKPSEMLFLLEKKQGLFSEEKLLLQSRAYLMLKEMSSSLACFDQLLKELFLKSKNYEEITLYFCKSLITENEPTFAIPYLKRLLTGKLKQEAEVLLLNCYQLTENYQEVKLLIQQHIAQDTHNDHYWTELGITCGKLAEVEEAIAALEMAVVLNEENVSAKKALAEIFLIQGKLDLALENLASVISYGEISQEILTDIADIYYLQKEYQKSLTTYIHAILENPYSAYEYMEIARILSEKPDVDVSEILKDIRTQCVENKASQDAEDLLNSLYRDLEHKAVENWIQKAIALDFQNQHDFRYYYGQWLCLQGRNDEALQQFQKAVDQNPHHVESWKKLAALNDTITKKIELLSSAVQYNFNDEQLYFLLADLYEKVGNKACSDYYFQLGLKIDPDGFLES